MNGETDFADVCHTGPRNVLNLLSRIIPRGMPRRDNQRCGAHSVPSLAIFNSLGNRRLRVDATLTCDF